MSRVPEMRRVAVFGNTGGGKSTLAKTLLSTANQMFKGDSDFSGVKLASVQKTGPVATLAVSVGVAGLDQLVAVSVDVKR